MEAVEKQIEEKVSGLKSFLEDKIEKLNEKAVESAEKAVDGKVDAAIKEQLKEALKEWKEIELSEVKNRMDSFEVELQKGFEQRKQRTMGLKEALADALKKDGVMSSLKAKAPTSLDFDELTGKAVGVITPQDNFTGEVVPADYRPGIIAQMQRSNHIRDLLGAGSTSSSVWRYVEQTGGEGAFANVAAGAQKGQIDYDFEAKDANVRKIAGFARVAEEVLEDVDGMPDFLARKLAKDLRIREDNQFLYGDGTGQNLTGLSINAATFAATTGDTNATIIDLMIQALSQLETADYSPNGIVLNPSDWYTIYTAKDSNGAYLMQELVTRENGQLRIAGVPVFKNTAVTAGTYFVGDWVDGVEIRDRKGLNVRFYEQDSDNRQKNLVTIVCEERLAFPIYYPESFIYGNIATDIAKIVAKT